MVGCRIVGLKMIPDDRPRSAQGPSGGFGQQFPNKNTEKQEKKKTGNKGVKKRETTKKWETNKNNNTNDFFEGGHPFPSF